MSHLASYEARVRWVAIISASLHELTLWRSLRNCYMQALSLESKLDIGLHKLEGILQDLWLKDRVLAFWLRIHDVVRRIIAIVSRLMCWVELRKWRKWDDQQGRHFVIKAFAVSSYYVTLTQNVYSGSFERLQNAFRYHGRVLPLPPLSRRWSHDGRNDYPAEPFRNRCKYEYSLLMYVRSIHHRYQRTISQIPRLYNSSQLFETLISDIQWQRQKEAEWYAVWGLPYPYPICKLLHVDGPRHDERSMHWPRDDIATWQDDKILNALLAG